MKRLATFVIGLAVLATACNDDRPAPASPTGPEPAAGPALTAVTPAGAGATCPCWTESSLQSTFPTASFFFTDLAAEDAAGQAALQLVDVANARQLQALTEFDPSTDTPGDNWCQVATFGQKGLERESISRLKITAEEFAGCVSLLRERAEAAGLESNGQE